MRKNLFYILLVAAFAASGIAHYAHLNSTIQFVIAGIAIVFVAGFLGRATESVAHYAGDRMGGFLNATFGNAAELIIAIILIKEAVDGKPALFEMVKASITGSIIGNLLLVLGLSVLFGGLRFKNQTYNVRLATHSASLMLLAVIVLFIPAMFAHDLETKELNELSIIVAILLIVAYFLWLFFSMVTHKKELSEEAVAEHGEALWSKRTSILFLVLATVMVALVSEWLVGTLEEFAHTFGLSEIFVGAFLIAIIGNAAEHSAAILLAMKNKMGAAVEIAVGSSLQIALFVAPVLVLVSFFMGNTMNFVFTVHELVAIGVAVFIAKSISKDGSTNWYEGVLLLTVYVILGIAFFLL